MRLSSYFFLCAAALFVCNACISCGGNSTSDDNSIPETKVRVLCIGNSFMVDATEFLPRMLKSAGIKTVDMDRAYHGGYSLKSYNTNYTNNTVCGWMKYRPGYASWKGDNSLVHSLKEVVESGVWDYVLLNDATSAGYNPSEEDLDAIRSLVGKIRAHQSDHPLKAFYVNTQPYGHGYSTLVSEFNNDQLAQFEAKNAKSRILLEKADFDDVISTGAMIQNLRASVLNVDPDGMDLTRDNRHLDYGISRYGAACTVFEKVFTPVFKVDIADVHIRTEWEIHHPSLYSTAVTDANSPIAIAAAKGAVKEPYSVTDLSAMTVGPSDGVYEEVFDDPVCVNFPVVFPLGYAGGKGRVTSDTQSRLRSEGVWECPDQPQAYMRMHWGPRFANEPSYCYITYLASQSKISSPEFLGLWTGDYMEFVLPVENAPGGTTIHFYAPFYGRQHPVFWDLEHFDEGQWKCERSEKELYGYKCNCSIALPVGNTYIEKDFTFNEAVDKGFYRIRMKVVDGSMQGNSQTSPSSMIIRDAPYQKSDGTYGAPVYFNSGDSSHRNAVVFELL